MQEADAAFASANAWAADYALYRALKKRFGGRPWWEWPEPYAHYPTAVTAAEDAAVKEDAACTLFAQRLFFEQWAELKAYAHEKGVRIIGDMPIYLSRDSTDVWRDVYKRQSQGIPRHRPLSAFFRYRMDKQKMNESKR